MKGNSVLLITLLVVAISCSSNKKQDAFIEDALRYCDVHKLSFWEKEGRLEALSQLNGMEKQAELSRIIRSSVKTREMQDIIYGKGAAVSAEEFYPYLQQAIPQLTGKPFDCPAIPEFYLPPYKEG